MNARVPWMPKNCARKVYMRVRVVQVDTRGVSKADFSYVYPADRIETWKDIVPQFAAANAIPKYHELTVRYHARLLGSEYEFVRKDPAEAAGRHLTWIKVVAILEELEKEPKSWDVLVFLDTDAWIVDAKALRERVLRPFVEREDKHVLFCQEPRCAESESVGVPQVFNTGFICMKPTEVAWKFWKTVWRLPEKNPSVEKFMKEWPYDQGCANFAFLADGALRSAVALAPLEWCNTPAGQIVRHCWIKELVPVLLAGDMLRLDKQKLSFLFYNPPTKRSCLMTYDSYVGAGGFSGTDGSILQLCKRLAESGHDAAVVCDAYHETFEDAHGIRYVSPADIVRDCARTDVFVPGFAVLDGIPLHVYRNMRAGSLVLPWCHCHISQPKYDSLLRAVQQHDLRCTVVGPSLFSLSHLAGTAKAVVPNGIDPRMMPPHPTNESGRWVFHTSFSRGGKLCMDIFSRMQACRPDLARCVEFMSYYLPDRFKVPEGVVFRDSMDKKRLFETLSGADYFVYPLVENSTVHHDTYACSVLEALACGVTVVTWDVACLREVFGDHVEFVDPPPHDGYDRFAETGANPRMSGDEAVQLFVDKILQIEKDQEAKKRAKERNRRWALAQSWDASFDRFMQVVREASDGEFHV
jgi:hypothetical protein